MALAPVTLRVCAMMLCLLGAARCSNGGKDGCLCPAIPYWPSTKPVGETCFNSTFRYTCIDGYVRKAGTSNLIKCSQINGAWQWTPPSLSCKLDPLRTTKHPPMTNTATPSFTRLQMTPTGSISPGEATDAHSTEPTSPGGQADHTQEFMRGSETTVRTSASLYQHFNKTTVNPRVSGHTDHGLGKTATGLIICASLVIACALIGLSYACYRRRSRNNAPPATEEEKLSMGPVASEPDS